MKRVGITSCDKGQAKKTTGKKQHQSDFELQKSMDCNWIALLAKSFDTINFRSGELIDMALQVQLEYTAFEIAELSSDEWIERLSEV